MATMRMRERKTVTTWQVRFRVNGKLVSETFESEDDAEYFLKDVELAALKHHGRDRYPENYTPGRGYDTKATRTRGVTLAEYYARWVDTRHNANARTADDYRKNFGAHVPAWLADKAIADITSEDVDTWLTRLREKRNERGPRRGKKISAKTVANIQGIVSASMKRAVADGLLTTNPFAGTVKDRGVRRRKLRRKDVLEPEEFNTWRTFIGKHYQPLVTFLYGTGLRWSEATALVVADVDLVHGEVHVERAWQRQPDSSFELDKPKTAQSIRTVTINAGLVKLLAKQIEGKALDEFVFTNTKGEWITPSAFFHGTWEMARQRAHKAGFRKHIRIHDLRHGHAAYLIAKGIQLSAISERLGHTSIAITNDVYGGLLQEVNKNLVSALDGLDMGEDEDDDPEAMLAAV